MKKKYFILVLINLVLLSFFLGYYSRQQNLMNILTINNFNLITSFKTKIVLKFDIDAYNQLRTLYIYKPNEGEFLFYSLIIANKTHHPQAYFDVFHELYSLEILNKKNCSAETRTLMIQALMIGAKLGHSQSKYELGKLYMRGKYLPQNSILGKKYILSSGVIP